MKKEFKIKDKRAIITRLSFNGYSVQVFSNKTGNKLATYQIHSIDGINSYTALMRACKDPSNQFCPQPALDDGVKTSQDGGNPPLLPVSLNPTAGGNLLLTCVFKVQNSVYFTKNAGFVMATVQVGQDKYRYPMSFENFYRIKKFNQDCLDRHRYQLGFRRLISLCKKYSYDKENSNVCVA